MKLADVEAILRALNEADARYLIVGGLAVVAHGYVRYTAVVEIVLNLERERPPRDMRVGSDRLQTARAGARRRFCRRNATGIVGDKNMLVFQLMAMNRPDTRLDVFVTEPFDFTAEFQLEHHDQIAGVDVPVIRIETLLAMKREAGRPKDLGDISELEALSEHRRHE